MHFHFIINNAYNRIHVMLKMKDIHYLLLMQILMYISVLNVVINVKVVWIIIRIYVLNVHNILIINIYIIIIV